METSFWLRFPLVKFIQLINRNSFLKLGESWSRLLFSPPQPSWSRASARELIHSREKLPDGSYFKLLPLL